ncbi:MerR family transcriptional regulator [Variovorax dokdonensis]|uniref:MerR family transcriptional regulator n=1 Tax=Variovorax dokdonensis TaxID=344883 RepID=A0ABT7N7M4_9BURK|nr:MerR family transcriptional regulator [Variovorax dokdonensis]MDM0043943.1 MerR family transcriptional regulator [Variovorax dokdonensis]
MEKTLPSIPAKRYFTIGEVAELCGVKPHVLRYWEQEFTQLRPMKRRGNRRYYQHHEVLMIRRIRDLLYDQGFTISGARNKLQELAQSERAGTRGSTATAADANTLMEGMEAIEIDHEAFEAAIQGEAHMPSAMPINGARPSLSTMPTLPTSQLQMLRRELFEIRDLLTLNH